MILLLITVILLGCNHSPAASSDPATVMTTIPTTDATETMQTEPSPDPVSLILEAMTTEEKVGQLFLARCPEQDAVQDIATYHLGGYILFGKDFEFETPHSVTETISSYQSAAKIPMLIAVDEEGGSVTRISCYSAFRDNRFSSLRKLYAKGGVEAILSEEAEKCQLLASLGINVNMAPVCDIATQKNAFMYGRSLGEDSEITSQVISAITELMDENKIGSVLKHFPGYGNNADTHTGISYDNRGLEVLKSSDLRPFAAGIEAGCDAILISHTIVNCLDSRFPASLSPMAHAYLREQMGFSGVIVTDDLVMDAITDQYDTGEAAVLAVLAGNDLLCSTDYREQYQAVLEAVTDGRISSAQLDAAVYRILRWKIDLGLLTTLNPADQNQ